MKRFWLFFLLVAFSRNAGATNYFNWGVESESTSTINGPNPVLGYFGGTIRDCGTGNAHTGNCAMKMTVVGPDGGNQQKGADIDWVRLPMLPTVGGGSIYYRAWVKYSAGFNWGSPGVANVKTSRAFLNTSPNRFFTGHMRSGSFLVAECEFVAGFGGGCLTTGGVPNNDYNIGVGYDIQGKNDGQWHEYIVRIKSNSTTSSQDAEMQAWVDGVSVGTLVGWKLTPTSSTWIEAWSGWMVTPYFQMNGDASVGGTVWVDDFSTDDVWNSSFSGGDVTPPVLSNGQPTGTFASGTTQVTMTLATNENATCRYSSSAGVVYSNMTSTFSTTGGTSHSTLVTGLTDGHTYNEYVRCIDTSGNANSSDYLITWSISPTPAPSECPLNWQSLHPQWLWCDDFETDKISNYFDNDSPVLMVRTLGVGFNGSYGRRATWTTGLVNAGSLKIAFGKSPTGLGPPPIGVDNTTVFRDIYYRVYLRSQVGWVGGGSANQSKFARALSIVDSSWSEAMLAHLWTNGNNGNNFYLMTDPATCVTGSTVNCVGYNDFAHIVFLGAQIGSFQVFNAPNVGNWNCIECHVKLNDPGQSNGTEEFWIDGSLQNASASLNFIDSYVTYGINTLFLENFINGGSPQNQVRDWDNLVISTSRIGCLGSSPAPPTGFHIVP